MKYYLLILTIIFFLFSCKFEKTELSAQQIVDMSIQRSGVEKLQNSTLSFNFRDKLYHAKRASGEYILKRFSYVDNDTIEDVLTNTDFKRIINGTIYKVTDSMSSAYSESINSVHYFSVLPFSLNDKAVQKKLLGESKVHGKDYYKIQITFLKDGGGVDYDDVFIYWIQKNNFKIDYLAYTFHVNGGGKRFRQVRKEHILDGVRFVDYYNYKPKKNTVDISSLDTEFEEKTLKKLSEINLINLTLKIN